MIAFYKYEGAGNDFILIDDRSGLFPSGDTALISSMCNRHFGIGADGLMLLRNVEGYDFEMIYYNSDGNLSSMCGNGGRCISSFAKSLGIVESTAYFKAVDGGHKAQLLDNEQVSLQMNDILAFERISDDALLIDTGSPHFVKSVDNVQDIDVVLEGRVIRNSERFKAEGVNVNFVETVSDGLKIRTYERGVENETLACGTGVTAAAIAYSIWGNDSNPVNVFAVGGKLKVAFQRNGNQFDEIWKTGPATYVFQGTWKA